MDFQSEEVKALYENTGWLEADLGKPQTVRSILISESVLRNSEIRGFEIQCEKDGKWFTIAAGTKMGNWTQNITPVTARKFRLVILDREGFSGIEEFQLYRNTK